jgi:hypothetical protein
VHSLCIQYDSKPPSAVQEAVQTAGTKTLRDIVTLSDGHAGGGTAVSVLARAAILDHHFDHHCTLFGLVRQGSP